MPRLTPPSRDARRLPIAVFDSGVGGLTVLAALLRSLPDERFVYLGDTARVPYGSKPLDMVRGFAFQIARALRDLPAKAVVIACNTASAAALPELAYELGVPVWGVVEPGVRAALEATDPGATIGLLGTTATVGSGVYQTRLVAAGRSVWEQPCPLFVPLVEEGVSDTQIARLVAEHYLARRPSLDAAILACTHYPLLKPVLRELLGPDVTLIDSSQAIAATVAAELAATGLAHPDAPPQAAGGAFGSRVDLLVTGDVASFVHVGARLVAPLLDAPAEPASTWRARRFALPESEPRTPAPPPGAPGERLGRPA